MIEIVGVRFKKVGKIYYFDGDGLEYTNGEHVIVETSRGIEYGTVALAKKEAYAGKQIVVLLPDSADRYYSTKLFID